MNLLLQKIKSSNVAQWIPDPNTSIPARKCEIVDLYFVYKFRENSKFVFSWKHVVTTEQ